MNNKTSHPARLALEDGTVFHGVSFGAETAENAGVGEVVFNTALTGYQEALTDPSYAGQILVMTATQIGNYGVCPEDVESERVQVAGFVIREQSSVTSNSRATDDLGPWLASQGIPAIEGIDTRALVRILRTAGAMRGVIGLDSSISDAALVEMARQSLEMTGRNLAESASIADQQPWEESLGDWRPMACTDRSAGDDRLRVLAVDCGGKRNIYRHLADLGCDVIRVNPSVTVEEIRAFAPDGLFVSNGPGDPAAVTGLVETLSQVAGEVPTFGICLGHQLLALALGASTWKLPFGHRGANQPVSDLERDRVEITSQNHGFCVDEESLLAAGCLVTHVHLNDRTVAGFRHAEKPIFAVQFHPEASPGPHDSSHLFEQFVQLMDKAREVAN
ncbi:MAG: glutamine-hydrolyzing carbamoyl-phosphate synthase small subunit [Phycisphaerales bacterium]|nr:glutamine-hydrolyzing carbamoyl-phosphate synthase small subunit [Phycisphaerales bacterium]